MSFIQRVLFYTVQVLALNLNNTRVSVRQRTVFVFMNNSLGFFTAGFLSSGSVGKLVSHFHTSCRPGKLLGGGGSLTLNTSRTVCLQAGIPQD